MNYEVKVEQPPKKTDFDKILEALEIAYRYGQIDGAHHKMWVIDQMVRALAGDSYEQWVEDYQGEFDVDECSYEYEWDEGIAP